MSKIRQTLLPTVLALLTLSPIKEAQLFEQTNVVYTAYVRNYDAVDADAGTGAIRLPNHVSIQCSPIEIIRPAQLQQAKDTDELAPLLLEILSQTVPNWQQQQRQLIQLRQLHKQEQQSQQQQHFFVYKNPQAVRLASQQPQILPEFNGVNVHQAQQQWQQQPQTVTVPQQQQQKQQPHQQLQYAQLPMPIHLQQQQQQYLEYIQTAPKIASAPPATTTATATTTTAIITATTTAPTPTASSASQPPAEGFLAPIGTLTSGFQAYSAQAEDNSPAALCPICCAQQEADTPCSCCSSVPLLGVAAPKASVG